MWISFEHTFSYAAVRLDCAQMKVAVLGNDRTLIHNHIEIKMWTMTFRSMFQVHIPFIVVMRFSSRFARVFLSCITGTQTGCLNSVYLMLNERKKDTHTESERNNNIGIWRTKRKFKSLASLSCHRIFIFTLLSFLSVDLFLWLS